MQLAMGYNLSQAGNQEEKLLFPLNCLSQKCGHHLVLPTCHSLVL